MTIYVELLNEEGVIDSFGSVPMSSNSIAIDVEPTHPIFNDNPRYYVLVGEDIIKSEELVLNRIKRAKDEELNNACNRAILAGFTHTIDNVTYWFSYDMEAQGNFRDAKEVLKDGIVTHINWTVREGNIDGNYTRVPIDLNIMNQLAVVILEHKEGNISRYRDTLLPLVTAATSVTEVKAIHWDMEI
jgi:hypothetical protein